MAQITVTTNTNSPSEASPRAQQADNGVLWYSQPDRSAATYKFYYSTNKGASWTEDTGARFYGTYIDNCAIFIIGDKIWALYDDVYGPSNNFIFFQPGTLNGARTSITWSGASNLWADYSGDYCFAHGMTVHAEGSGYKAHCVYSTRYYGENRYARLDLNSLGLFVATDVNTSWSSAGIEGPNDTLRVIHDPVTKDIFLSAMTKRGGGISELWFQKRAYSSATWPAGSTTPLATTEAYCGQHEVDFDGDRWVAVIGNDTSDNTPSIVERDKADTTTTVRKPGTGVAGSISGGTSMAIQINASKDVLITWNDYGGDATDIYKNTYSRSGGTWAGHSLVRDTTPNTSVTNMNFIKGTKYFFFTGAVSGYDVFMLDDMVEVAYTAAPTLQSVFTMTATPSFVLAGGTSIPRPLVEVAFTTDPTSEIPIWTDVTQYVVQMNIRRGRQRELDVIEPGTASFTLDNDDRRFDPLNTASPYYPNIKPVKRIRVRAIWNSQIYNVFSGYAAGWPQEYPGKHRTTVSLDAVDATGFLSFADLTLSRVQELTGARVEGILNSVNWPTTDRNLDTGQETLAAVTGEETNALDALQEVAATELGRLFADKAGRVTFHGRDRISGTHQPASSGTWTDGALAGNLYDDIVPSQDEGEIRNRISITREGGVEQVAQDVPSQTSYFIRDYGQSGLKILTDADSLARAQFLLSQYKDPQLRFISMTVDPRADDAWTPALNLEIGDHILVKRFSSSAIIQDVFVDGISHDISRDKKSWIITFSLTPVVATGNYWIIGTSRLGVDTTLGF